MVKAEVFYGDKALVVVKGYNKMDVGGALACPHKYGVGRPWPGDTNAARLGDCNGGGDDRSVFISDGSPFRGMGVESSNRNVGTWLAVLVAIAMGDLNGFKQLALGNSRGHVFKWNVDGMKEHP